MRFKPGYLREVSPASGVLLGPQGSVAECRYMKEFGGKHTEFRLLVAICGNGPFDWTNFDETMSANSPGMSSKHGGSTKGGSQLVDQLIRDRRTSDTSRNISYLMPLIGHGVSFVPTSVTLDSTSHTSFVVQIPVGGKEEFQDLSRLEEVGLALYQHVTRGR